MEVTVTVKGHDGGRYSEYFADVTSVFWKEHKAESVLVIAHRNGGTDEYVGRHVIRVNKVP